jgi:NAD(P)-dependent dehydrogenase (short-subunit alcohol dehydrogenase family)
MNDELKLSGWALILGASSGFGEATALELARRGMDIFGVHLDRRATMANVERIVGEIRGLGRRAEFWNVNAADEEKRAEVLAAIAGQGARVRVLLHSLAFGTLRPFIHAEPKEGLSKQQLEMTLDVMAHSLVYWTQDLVARGLFERGGRIFAMTSTGSGRVWSTYGAVSAAKAALESHIRQLAFELAPHGISANAILAGVTDTPALRKIPGSDKMAELAKRRNPHGRLTTPADVASTIAALSFGPAGWVNGNTVCVDGGEEIAG